MRSSISIACFANSVPWEAASDNHTPTPLLRPWRRTKHLGFVTAGSRRYKILVACHNDGYTVACHNEEVQYDH